MKALFQGLLKGALGGVTSIFGGIWGYVGVAVVVAGLTGYGTWTVNEWKNSGTITGLQGDVAHWKSQTGIASGNTTTAWHAYDRCQSSLGYLKNQSDGRTAAADTELKRLRADKAARDARLASLLASKPAPGADLCAAADALILEYVK